MAIPESVSRALRKLGAPILSITLGAAISMVPSATSASAGSSVWAFDGLAGRRVMALALSPDFTADHTVFAGTDQGVYGSTDGGNSWTPSGLTKRVISLAVSPDYSTDNTVFALVAFPTSYGVYRTTNAGVSWQPVKTISGYNVLSVAVSPDFASDGTVFAGREKSTDGGDNWSPMTLTTNYVYSFAISPDISTDQTVFAGTDDGVYKSTDAGGSWAPASSGVTNKYVGAVAISPDYSTDQIVFAGTTDGGVFKTVNGGGSWVPVRSGAPPTEYVSALAVSPDFTSDQTVFLGTNWGFYESTDGGGTWAQVQINSGLQTTSVESVAVSPDYATDGTVFVGVYGGVFSYPHPLESRFIILNSGGWSDPAVGVWDGATETGTLTKDVSRMILIESDGVTLDGDSHTVMPKPAYAGDMWSAGVFLEGRKWVTVERLGVGGFGFGIGLRQSSNNTLFGNDASSNIVHGIHLTESDNNTLTANISNGSIRGIYLGDSNSNTIAGNIANGNEGAGIDLFSSNDNTLSGNTTDNDSSGIVLVDSDSNDIVENAGGGNEWAGIYLVTSSANILTLNDASGNPSRGIYLNGSSGNTLTRNTVDSNTWSGIKVGGGNSNKVAENIVSSNTGAGIHLGYYTTNNQLTANTITSTMGTGIWIEGNSHVNSVVGNTISDNTSRGIQIDGSDYTYVLHNNFINNDAAVSSSTGSVFNNPAPVGGNFWSNWTSPDADGDWFVDNPYTFYGGQDNLPWTLESGWDINRPPTVAIPVVNPEPSFAGQLAGVSATFTDTDGVQDAPFTCTIDHGDGSGELPGAVTGFVCTGPAHLYETFGSCLVTVTVADKDGDTGSSSAPHVVVYPFEGFLAPIDNPPALNTVNARAVVSIRFGLGADEGLAIFTDGYPASRQIDCYTFDPLGQLEETVCARKNGLTYDSEENLYVYLWKTEKAWSGTCRLLEIQLIDGTVHQAYFSYR